MRITVAASIACLVAAATAFEYPDFVPLHKRQAPGTPQYDCHANCGGIITLSRSQGYCDTDEFETKLSACLDCALEYDIWKWYGNSVSNAAEECGVDATPIKPSSSSSSTETATATETGTESDQPTITTEASIETTSAPEETAIDSTTVSSASVIPTVTAAATPSPSGSSASGTPTPADPEFTGGASLNKPAGLLIGGVLGPLVAALM
ncbi:uncharacterized protein BDV17DRAFT_288530 [Aspergillus undulatus]|uniref:uncharacterized protein n=1 Tax=Aspergillus undulatus TaxID=1810928 RepID=UPI003CCD112C